jgi:hypothetical protein
VAARVGGAFIAELVEFSTGLNLWAEWARIEICSLRGVPYVLPEQKHSYAGQRLCLARTDARTPLRSTRPRWFTGCKKSHHAGLARPVADPERVAALLDEYSGRFAEMFLATAPVPLKPTN